MEEKGEKSRVGKVTKRLLKHSNFLHWESAYDRFCLLVRWSFTTSFK